MTQASRIPVKVVTFDADDTLWDFDGSMRAGLARVREEIRRLAPASGRRLNIEAMIAARERADAELKPGGASLLEIRREGFRRCLPAGHSGDDALVDRLLGVYLEQRDRLQVPFDDVVPALDRLKGNLILGIISNGNSRPERHGLGGWFDFVLLSDDHGIEKPDHRVFEMAADAAGCAVRDMAHVGDNPLTDVEGANHAGAVSIWLNRTGRDAMPGEPRAARVISSLKELSGVVADLRER